MIKIRAADNTVLAATHGRGMQWAIWDYDTTTDIEELAESSFSIYPNPSNGLINIDMKSSDSFRVDLFNFKGNNVLNRTFEGNLNQLNLSDLPKGVYLISINQNGKESSNKLILE